MSPFVPLSGSNPPLALDPDVRAWPGPLPFGHSAGRVAVLPKVTVLEGDRTRVTNLALGWTKDAPLGGAHSLAIVDELDPKNPKYLGSWPTGYLQNPIGQEVGDHTFELPYVTPAVDPLTGLFAVPVYFPSKGNTCWAVIDPKDPRNPKMTAFLPANGRWGAFHNGRLAVMEGNQLKTWKIVDGVAGVDEGECNLFPDRCVGGEHFVPEDQLDKDIVKHAKKLRDFEVLYSGQPMDVYVMVYNPSIANHSPGHAYAVAYIDGEYQVIVNSYPEKLGDPHFNMGPNLFLDQPLISINNKPSIYKRAGNKYPEHFYKTQVPDFGRFCQQARSEVLASQWQYQDAFMLLNCDRTNCSTAVRRSLTASGIYIDPYSHVDGIPLPLLPLDLQQYLDALSMSNPGQVVTGDSNDVLAFFHNSPPR